jgi:phosphate transport system protein
MKNTESHEWSTTMLGSLIAALRSNDALDKAFLEFNQMLESGHWMYKEVQGILDGSKNPMDSRDAIFLKDQEINNLLRSLRSNLVTHLSINKNADFAACLVLMSIAKDAERIGDYCKNLFEIGVHDHKREQPKQYATRLDVLPGRLEEVFNLVGQAFPESSTKLAKAAIRAADAIRSECDSIENDLLAEQQRMETHDAAACSLKARYYKRLASHLANIATAIFGRIEDLNFRKPPKPDDVKSSGEASSPEGG